jgi:hypothetical protein
MRRSRVIVLAAVAISVAGLVLAHGSNRRNCTEIRARYAKLRAALSAADTNAVLALVAPEYRSRFDGGDYMRLDDFARPLGARSKVLLLGAQGTVWPKPNWYLLGVWPIGDTVEVTKVGGHWFFPGKVHLD